MDLYEAIYNRRVVRDFKDKVVPDEVLKRIIDAGMQAPTHDHLRNWEFVILKDKEDKERALQFVRQGVEPTLEILKKTLTDGTLQQNVCSCNAKTVFNANECISCYYAIF